MTFNDIEDTTTLWEWMTKPLAQHLYPVRWCVTGCVSPFAGGFCPHPHCYHHTTVFTLVHLRGAVFAPPRDNDMLFDDTQLGYVLGYYRRVGPVRLRQFRVTNSSCTERQFAELRAMHHSVWECGACVVAAPCALCHVPPPPADESLGRFQNKDNTCWSDFSALTEDTRPYGPGNLFKWWSRHALFSLR